MDYINYLKYKILFKSKDPAKIEVHPKYDLHIKYSFSVGDRHYYTLRNPDETYANRYRYLKTYSQECENKITNSDIDDFSDATLKYLKEYKESVHKGEPKPHMLDKAEELQRELKHRSVWLFEITTLYKYASVLYFTLDENIKDYDVGYNHEKIEIWSKKKRLYNLLLKELITGVEDFLNLSQNDSDNYIQELQQAVEKAQKLISEAGVISNRNTIEAMI